MRSDTIDFLRTISLPAKNLSVATINKSFHQRYTRALHKVLEYDQMLLGDTIGFIDSNMEIILSSPRLMQCGLGILDDSKSDGADYLAQFLLLLTCLGGIGKWKCHINRPVLVFLDCYPVQLSGIVEIHSDGNRIRLRDDNATRNYSLNQRHWVESDNYNLVTLRQSGLQIQIFSAQFPFSDMRLLGDLPLSSSTLNVIEKSVTEAFALIELYYPEFVDWIALGLKAIVFLEAPADRSLNGSAFSHPGFIYVTFPIEIDLLAVAIVHECAHQYFRMCEHHVKLVDRIGETTYSPFRKTQRPVEKVMLTLHAAVNIRRFTQRLLDKGFITEYVLNENHQLAHEIISMKSNLERARSITSAGRQFVDMMCEP